MIRAKHILSFTFLLSSFISFGQRNLADSAIGATWLGIQYGANLTAGDLADRYGFMNHIGIFAGYKTKRNWVYGMDANFMFGNDVRISDIFHHLRDEKGNITDVNGDNAVVRQLARGISINGTVGKIFPVFNPNPNSGIYVNIGAGYLLHRLRVETQDHVVPQLELDYKKGYDRLTIGPNTSQFLGYAFMSDQGSINFFGGIYAQQGFTYNQREINFDQPETPVSTDVRIDMQFGLKIGWLIPIYKRQPKEFYYN